MNEPWSGRALARHVSSQAFASDGTPFDPSSDLWRFRTLSGAVNFNYALLRGSVDDSFVNAAKMAMKLLVETRNLNSVNSAFLQLRKLALIASQRQTCRVEEIDAEDFALWCMRGNGVYIGQLRPILDTWRKLKLPGLACELYEFVEAFRVPTSSKKDAVRTWNPDAGAYRPAEDAALKSALDAGFNNGMVDLYEYALVRTFRGIGMRPAQLAAMKVEDLRRIGSRVELRIPLAKRRGMPERGGFMPWKPITQGLADILFMHITENVLPRLYEGDDPSIAQLFPPKRKKHIFVSTGVEEHQGRDALHNSFVRAFDCLSVISPITGRKLNVNPTRERHTVLTGLAMLGCNALEIAANAGHVDPNSCEAYVDASIDHFQRMERLVGDAFIPLADRFLGKVVRQQNDQASQQDPDAVLRDKDMTGMGSCGTGGCEAIDAGVAPVACYTCRKFRAWADAPHENILAALLEQQRGLNEAGHAEVAETKTATIVAISDLLEAINGMETENG